MTRQDHAKYKEKTLKNERLGNITHDHLPFIISGSINNYEKIVLKYLNKFLVENFGLKVQ